jgi:hypothetical protein
MCWTPYCDGSCEECERQKIIDEENKESILSCPYKYEYILNENVVIGPLGLLDSDIKKFNTFEDAKKYIDEVLKKQEIIYHYID